MSGLHVYCVVSGDSIPPRALLGLGGRPVAVWRAADLGAWASVLDAPPSPSGELLRAHHDVVLAAFRVGSVLPVRFGQWLPDSTALESWLEREKARMCSAIEHLRDAVEFGVRVVGGEGEPVDAPPAGEAPAPREYLRTLARHRAAKRDALLRRDALARRLWSAVGPVAREQCAVPAGPGDLAAVAHLVDRAQVAPYREAVGRFMERQAPFRAEITGPWPPWSFVT